MAPGLVEKVCPIVLRGSAEAREILVFRHPQAGVQLVKGTREPGEAIVVGALRELAEEAGIAALSGRFVASSSAIAPDQLWHFVLVDTSDLPDQWSFDTLDDGGHRFDFFWWPLLADASADWHRWFVEALNVARKSATELLPDAAKLLAEYAQVINHHRFDAVAPLIAQDAVFWFGDGSHVGIAAIRAALETTWRNLVDETYWVEDVRWIAEGTDAACCRYSFHWRAVVDSVPQAGSGRGTSVVARKADGWRIVHEHLSGMPGPR